MDNTKKAMLIGGGVLAAFGIYMLWPKKASAAPVTVAPKVLPKPPAPGTSGTFNKDVATVQQALKQLGYDPGPVDGILGPKTIAAIAKYQKDRNIPGNGDWNEPTSTAMGTELGYIAKVPEAAASEPSDASETSEPAADEATPYETYAKITGFGALTVPCNASGTVTDPVQDSRLYNWIEAQTDVALLRKVAADLRTAFPLCEEAAEHADSRAVEVHDELIASINRAQDAGRKLAKTGGVAPKSVQKKTLKRR